MHTGRQIPAIRSAAPV